MPKAASYTLSDSVSLFIYEKVNQIPSLHWNSLLGDDPWLRTDWLQLFESAGGPATKYLFFARGDRGIGVCLLQQLPVGEMQLGTQVRPQLASIVFGDSIYQFGQALFSGRGGHCFHAKEDPVLLMQEARKVLNSSLSSGAWLIKDLSEEVQVNHWLRIRALPEMSISISTEWRSITDYLACLPSKYRRRFKRARKKFGDLISRELTAAEADTYASRIDELYSNLRARAKYVPFTASVGYISKLKTEGKDRIKLLGYFDGDRLVGFSTLLVSQPHAIAHFAAIDPAYNASHQLYLNLLFDLLAHAISAGAGYLNFGRTATTIKSSLGAKPIEQFSYARHDGCIRHQLLSVLNDRVLADEKEQKIQQPLG